MAGDRFRADKHDVKADSPTPAYLRARLSHSIRDRKSSCCMNFPRSHLLAVAGQAVTKAKRVSRDGRDTDALPLRRPLGRLAAV